MRHKAGQKILAPPSRPSYDWHPAAPVSKPAAEQAIPPRWPLVEIRRFVTQVAALGDFYLGNVHVQTNVGTTFEGGTLNDILLGAHL